MSDTVTVYLRMPKDEITRLEAAARELGMDRSTFMKMALRLGASNVLLEQASGSYRRGEITLSKAAEIAGVSLHDLLAKMDRYDLQLSYGPEELAKDLNS